MDIKYITDTNKIIQKTVYLYTKKIFKANF